MTEQKKQIIPIKDNDDHYNITREKVIDMMIQDRDFAYRENKVVAAISVTKLFGDSIGMFKTQEQAGSVFNFNKEFTQGDMDSLRALGCDFAKIKIDPNKI